jgi:hypothetical protein
MPANPARTRPTQYGPAHLGSVLAVGVQVLEGKKNIDGAAVL